MNASFQVAFFMMLIEMLGALIFYMTKDSAKRVILSFVALGFAYAIIIADIIPDATEDFQWGYLIAIGAIGIMFLLELTLKHAGNYTAVGGMAFHNIFEGIMLVAEKKMLVPFVIVGVLLHKCPEGMITFSLLPNVKNDKVKFAIAAAIGLLIPVGALLPIPEAISKPITGFAAGVMLYAISKTLKGIVSEHFDKQKSHKSAMILAAMAGAIIGGVSCLMI